MNWDAGVIIVCILCNVVSFLSIRAAKNDDRLDLNIRKAKVITPQLFNVSKGHQTQRALAKQSHIIVGRNSDIVCSFNSKRRANILHKKVYEMFDQNEIKWNQKLVKEGKSCQMYAMNNECLYYMYYVKWSVKWHKFVHLSQKADKNVAFGSGKGARGEPWGHFIGVVAATFSNFSAH